ncbi:MAG TPA: acyl-CoA dehydrogenase family protein [Xanthobacteraceae bacterium]|nr:acyl-CoA dehydrogenase family protein [Xanthobacteraceae bacterium]
MTTEAFATHEVLNQAPPPGDVDLWSSDAALQGAVRAFGRPSEGDEAALAAFGRRWGTADMAELGRLANEHPPRLKTFDSRGYRANWVEFHPAYHALMKTSMAAGLHCSTWGEGGRQEAPNAHVLRAAKLHMAGEVEAGHLCPIVMTHAATAALLAEPPLVAEWLPRLRSREYDAGFRPASEKRSVTLGMGMTEKQGGTDVRANTTRAELDSDHYRLVGHKWFLSAPMCDAFLVLAQAPGGLTCFLVPRFLPDGSVNRLRFNRLKDKLGNRSNASSEVEFENAFALRCGAEGAGIRTIIAMVQLTRLDCVVASAGLMQGALAFVIHHIRHRSVFQKKLVDQPLMRTVAADLALEREGAVALAMRLASAFDRAGGSAEETSFARIMTPAAKLLVCKTAPGFIYEAMECLGGNGYVEEWPLARAYREAPVNAIWEGSGNVMALDLLRGVEREREGMELVVAGLAESTRGLPGARTAVERVASGLQDRERETMARRTGETLALLAALDALTKSAPPAIAEAFALHRMGGLSGRSYGEPIPSQVAETLLERSLAVPR